MATARRYLEPVHGRPTTVSSERVREDAANINGYIEDAIVYVDMQDQQEWVDCFRMNRDTYDMTVCPCFYPSIVCRAMDDEAAHNRATSKQIQEIITGFKVKMGSNNYTILNALRKIEKGVDTTQRAAANVAEQAAEVEQQPPPPPVVQIQQLDGTASSTPSRSNASPQAYDEYDEFKISLQAWHCANWEFITEAQAAHKVFEMFKAAGETAAADSLAGYTYVGGRHHPPLRRHPV